jgi:hypothetical protein
MTRLCSAAHAPENNGYLSIAGGRWNDPMDPDDKTDPTVSVSTRSLVRLALAATEVGARFQRDALDHDAMSWMLAPRRLYGGESAVFACLDLKSATRTIILHGLGLGLDAEPWEIDELVSDDQMEEEGEMADLGQHGAEVVRLPSRSPKLWTSVLVDEGEDGTTQAFEALIAPDSEAARDRIRLRHGARMARNAEIREGFDATQPLAEVLLAPAMQNMLAHVALDPGSPLARGLEVSVAQRFAE